jgi:hypothetical protein
VSFFGHLEELVKADMVMAVLVGNWGRTSGNHFDLGLSFEALED